MSLLVRLVGPGMGPMPESDAQRPPPSEAYLRELEEQLLAEFGERNARIERLRRLRHMETAGGHSAGLSNQRPRGAHAAGARATQTGHRQPHRQPPPGARAAGRTHRGRPRRRRPARPLDQRGATAHGQRSRARRVRHVDRRHGGGRRRRAEAALRAGPLGGLPAALRQHRRARGDVPASRRTLQEVRPLPAGLAGRRRHHLLPAGRRGRPGSLPGNRRTPPPPGAATLRADHRQAQRTPRSGWW